VPLGAEDEVVPGSAGTRIFDWAVDSLPVDENTSPPGWFRWLLVRRSLNPGRAAWAWSRWRRRQHRAKTSHYQRRPAVHNDLLLESQAAGRKLRAAAHS
jgi:hypothetical protein